MKSFAIVTIVSLFLCAGCTTQHDSAAAPDPAISRTALQAREGVGRLFFAATDDGVVYVYDADTGQFVFAAPIKKDQRFVLDPQHDKATVEAKLVYEKPLARKHTHRIYFDPHGKMPKAPAEEKNAAPPTTAPAK